jgi:hypothetical protein
LIDAPLQLDLNAVTAPHTNSGPTVIVHKTARTDGSRSAPRRPCVASIA